MAVTTKNYSVKVELNPRTKQESILFAKIETIVKDNEKNFADKAKLQENIEAEIQKAITEHNAIAKAEPQVTNRKPTRLFHMGHGASHIWISTLVGEPKSQGELISEGKSLGEVMSDRAVLITFQNDYK
jgi:hypothetical protein